MGFLGDNVLVADEDIAALRERGYSDEEILEITAELYRWHPMPVSNKPGFDWDDYLVNGKKGKPYTPSETEPAAEQDLEESSEEQGQQSENPDGEQKPEGEKEPEKKEETPDKPTTVSGDNTEDKGKHEKSD